MSLNPANVRMSAPAMPCVPMQAWQTLAFGERAETRAGKPKATPAASDEVRNSRLL